VLWHREENTKTRLQTLSVYSEGITDNQLSVYSVSTDSSLYIQYPLCKITREHFNCLNFYVFSSVSKWVNEKGQRVSIKLSNNLQGVTHVTMQRPVRVSCNISKTL